MIMNIKLFFILLLQLNIIVSLRPIDQVKHVIIFMQENRAFDHYFGKLKGVRGFNDRVTTPLKSGFNAFYQPIDQNNLNEYMLPFHADANKTNAMCMPAPEMYYPTDISIWNSGRMDSWNTARDPGLGMSYFTRDDLPYYYALYDEFVCGDQYFQSTFTCTNPNRLMLFSGSNGLSVDEEVVLENDEPRPGFNWTTMGEILEQHNISWKVYQQYDNFDDNAFAWFANYQKSRPGDVLYDKGMSRQLSLIKTFNEDLSLDQLPQVSWIIAPTRKSEHATNHPCAGEDFTARILSTLKDFPDVYAKTVFILNYDEGGQFYDHAWTPTPPLEDSIMKEGIATMSVEGEVNRDVLTTTPAPIGLGFRVPLLVVSPWTRGNIVVSEIFDHTSIIKFLEERFHIYNPNISPWRRAITGNLLSAFDFDHPDTSWPSQLPDTTGYVEEGDIQCHTLPPIVIPEEQSMPAQEQGTRISRALPYEFLVSDSVSAIKEDLILATTNDTTTITTQTKISFDLFINNTGLAGAPFVLYDIMNLATINPRQYAIESKKSISDSIQFKQYNHSSEGMSLYYSYGLLGPNGFYRQFDGYIFNNNVINNTNNNSSNINNNINKELSQQTSNTCMHYQALRASASLKYDINIGGGIILVLENKIINLSQVILPNGLDCNVNELTYLVVDNAYNQLNNEVKEIIVQSGEVVEFLIDTSISGNWYDLTVSLLASTTSTSTTMSLSSSSYYLRRYMGRMETNRDTISDPAMGNGLPGLWMYQNNQHLHPKIPQKLRKIERVEGKHNEFDKDAEFYVKSEL